MPPQRPTIVNTKPVSEMLFGEDGTASSEDDSLPKRMAKMVADLLGIDEPEMIMPGAVGAMNVGGKQAARAIERALKLPSIPKSASAGPRGAVTQAGRRQFDQQVAGQGVSSFGQMGAIADQLGMSVDELANIPPARIQQLLKLPK